MVEIYLVKDDISTIFWQFHRLLAQTHTECCKDYLQLTLIMRIRERILFDIYLWFHYEVTFL